MKQIKTFFAGVYLRRLFLGAGFISGQELWQFFGAFGNWGYVGFVLAALLFTVIGILFVRLTQMTKCAEMDKLLVPWDVKWLRAATGVIGGAVPLLCGGEYVRRCGRHADPAVSCAHLAGQRRVHAGGVPGGASWRQRYGQCLLCHDPHFGAGHGWFRRRCLVYLWHGGHLAAAIYQYQSSDAQLVYRHADLRGL